MGIGLWALCLSLGSSWAFTVFGIGCFNPHPARRLDATNNRRSIGVDLNPFQSSSSPKAGCNFCCGALGGAGQVVSILIQPEGWMQRPQPVVGKRWRYLFQSSSSPKAGCNDRNLWLGSDGDTCFNPHPARRLDATTATCGWEAMAIPVSILIQPEGWMQLASRYLVSELEQFQSSSSPKAGCNTSSNMDTSYRYMFQSSSSPKAGCNPLGTFFLLSHREPPRWRPKSDRWRVISAYVFCTF